MADTLQIGLYRIDTENDIFSSNKQILHALKDEILNGDLDFVEQKINKHLPNSFSYSLIYKRERISPKWKNFLASVASLKEKSIEFNKTVNESFVFLIFVNLSKELYAVTGGQGHFAVQEFIDDEFGIDILSRLINKSDKVLKALSEKNVIGSVLGSSKHFRNEYNLFENDSFGKIYQELIATLDKSILVTHFGFNANDIKKESVCVAKSSFKINKAVTFSGLLKIVSGCEYVMKNLKPIMINNVRKLTKKRDQSLIARLTNVLFDQLWMRYSKPAEGFDFDMCHKNYEKYLIASSFRIKKNHSKENFFDDFDFAKLVNIDQLFTKIKKSYDAPASKEEFDKLIESLKIFSYDEEGNESTRGTVLAHTFGDVQLDDRKYFYIDNHWYKIDNKFLQELDLYCAQFIKNNVDMGLSKKWNISKDGEDGYNVSYVNGSNTLVLHKINPENIELCDILKWDKTNVYLYHIKTGFNNSMRELCSQVIVSANRMSTDLNSTEEYLGKVYDQLSKLNESDSYNISIKKQTKSITRDEFLDIFKNKTLIFVIAIMDDAKIERKLENIKSFRSNIAKFSLQELSRQIRGLEFGCRVSQIKRA